MERHLETFRRDLTLDLFTRHGPIWSLVSRARERWHIEPAVRIPPAPVFKHVHLPDFLLGTRRPAWPIEAEEDYIRWMVFLEQMHHELIPPDLRVEDIRFDSADFWDGFLSACILYDPSPEDLLGFADHPITSYGAFRSSQDPAPEAGAPLCTMSIGHLMSSCPQ